MHSFQQHLFGRLWPMTSYRMNNAAKNSRALPRLPQKKTGCPHRICFEIGSSAFHQSANVWMSSSIKAGGCIIPPMFASSFDHTERVRTEEEPILSTPSVRHRSFALICNLYSITGDPRRSATSLAPSEIRRATSADPRRLCRLFRRRSSATRKMARASLPRAYNGALGHAVAEVRAQWSQERPWRDQHPQFNLATLATMARRRKPVRRPVHELCRK